MIFFFMVRNDLISIQIDSLLIGLKHFFCYEIETLGENETETERERDTNFL
jgi:hypothetical protein